MSTVVIKCNCQNSFQDKEYGQNNRVANVAQGNKEAVCTVCNTNHKATDFTNNPRYTK